MQAICPNTYLYWIKLGFLHDDSAPQDRLVENPNIALKIAAPIAGNNLRLIEELRLVETFSKMATLKMATTIYLQWKEQFWLADTDTILEALWVIWLRVNSETEVEREIGQKEYVAEMLWSWLRHTLNAALV